MGYRADKEKVENKFKLVKRISLGILLLCLVGLSIFSAFVPPNTWKYYVGLPNVGRRKAGEARVHFLNVGQGDCSLIELPDGKVMLIDGGDYQVSTQKTVLRYLNALKIDVIDYLVISHADEDHCGALDVVLKYKKVLNAYLPPTYPIDGTEYAEAYEALEKEKCNLFYTSRATDCLDGAYKGYTYALSFLSPYSLDVENVLNNPTAEYDADLDNQLSAVTYFDYQGVGVLFTGDVDFSVEENLMRDDGGFDDFDARDFDLSSTEILKVAHHGSKYSTSKEFLEYLHTETAVISCGAGNPYGHPTNETLSRLTAVGASVWRTDLDGHVVITIAKSGEYRVKTIK
ncbi:MAG: MBL fold metallo-hydrolase [Clostridia bacterium]|nr:MBL fold metallo-hydrolase [Clostridia bacterium]